MQGEIHRSEGPKWFLDILKYTEDSRKTGFREWDRCLGSEFGEWVLIRVCTDIWHVMCQVLYKSEKPVDVIVHPWGSPFSYPLHLISISISMDSPGVNNMTEALHPL
jgi:hypothetical protein